MSTLDVTCDQCDKRFRVRAEFAGKSTRCPGCSSPMTISAARVPAPPREERAERPRPRPRDDEDDRSRPPVGNWRPVVSALGREQVAAVFGLLTILGGYMASCLGNVLGGPGGMEELGIAVMLLVLVGPLLVAAIFGVSARVAALGVPAESRAKGTAVASLLCGLAGLAALVLLGLFFLASFDRPQRSELPMVVAVGGLLLSALGALGTFVGFVAQVGIVRRSAEVSAAIGRTAVAVCTCVLVLVAIGILFALAVEATTPSYSYGPVGYGRDDQHYLIVINAVLLPFGLAVILIMYHRLLAATRRAVLEERAGRNDA
jgi:hypothetical protein